MRKPIMHTHLCSHSRSSLSCSPFVLSLSLSLSLSRARGLPLPLSPPPSSLRSIVLRYTQDKFQDAHALTIGAAFVSKDLSIVSSSRGKNLVRLHIWDTAGEEAYRSMTRFFYREAEIGIVVYDVTNKLSFQVMKMKFVMNVKSISMYGH